MKLFAQRSVLHLVAAVVAWFSASALVASPSALAAQAAGGAAAKKLAAMENEAAPEAGKQIAAQERQSMFDSLLQEMDAMVPGEFEEGSQQKAELERAVVAFLDRDIKKLNEILDEQTAFDPDFPPRLLMLASMSFRIKSPVQGRELLEKAAVKNSKYPGIYAAFARLALAEGRIADSMAQLEKCARVVGETKVSAKARKHFGKEYVAGMMQVALAQGRYPAARDFFEKHKELSPDNPKSYLVGAEIEFKSGDIAKSQAYLEKLKELVPEARPFESVFARWFRDQGNTEAVGKWVAAAAEKYPNDIASQMDYVNWLMRKGDFATGKAVIDKIEALSGETPATQWLKGQIAFAENNLTEAERLLEKTVSDAKGNALEASNLYSLALAESSDPEKMKKAQMIAQQNLGRSPRNSVIQATLGYILLRQGNTEKAQQLILPAVRSNRVSSEVAYFFGVLANTLGNNDAAREALQSALKNQSVFLYRTKAQSLLNQLGGPIQREVSEPEPEAAQPMPLPEP